MRRFFPLLLVVLFGCLPLVRAARDDERLSQLKDEIRTLETMAADNASATERSRLAHRLELLQQELAILEKRQALEKQEHALRVGHNLSPREQLRETLQSVPLDSTVAEGRLRDLAGRRVTATADRDAMYRALADLPRRAVPADAAAATKRATLEEKIYTANEQLRAIALQQVAAEDEIDLVHQAQVFRDRIRTTDASGRPSLRNLFSQRIQLMGESDTVESLKERIVNLDESLRNSEAALGVARETLGKVDEELQLLGQQTGFLRRNPRVEQVLATEQVRKNMLGERLPFLTDQVEALRKSRDLLGIRRALSELQGRYIEDQLHELQAGYLQLLYVPTAATLTVILIYILLSRGLLPRLYKKEGLFLARRIGRYAVVSVIATVVAIYLIEDIALLATTLGLVSAAIVISLQDVFASFFAWFAIMLGRKFTIGDRLEVDGVRGEVLDVQILSTTLVEINNWLGADQPTGRVLFIPNHFVFKSKVFNFSRGLPYVWNKLDLTITFDTPLVKATDFFQQVLDDETRADFELARNAAAMMERHYGVDDADYRPKIYTKIADSGVTFSLIYVCHYRSSSTTRSRINRRLLLELEKHKDIRLAFNTLTVLASTTPVESPPPAGPVTQTTANEVPTAELGRGFSQLPFAIRVKGQ